MVVATDVDICNMALDYLGKPSIVSLDEGSAEAQACVRQYDIARRACLVRSPWTFARELRSLSLLGTNDLSDVWEYHYDLPNDLLKLHRLVEAAALPMPNDEPTPMYIEQGTVYTNIENALALFTFDNTDPATWSPLFDDAVALQLAVRMAPGMTRRKSDVDQLQDAFRAALIEAIMLDAQQETSRYTYHEGGYVDARGAGTRIAARQTDGSTIWG